MCAERAAALRLLADAITALAAVEEQDAAAVSAEGFVDRRTCAQLGIGEYEFEAGAKSGAFPLYTVGKRIGARRADVIAWVLSQSAEQRRAELAERARGLAKTKVAEQLDSLGVAKPKRSA